jgi:hypothetical protein
MIHYSEGRVAIDGQRVDSSTVGSYQEYKFVNEGETLSTDRGRAEVLLNPGTFLRVGDNSSVRLISSQLEDTRIRLESGTAMIEVSEFDKLNSVAVEVGTSVIKLQKQGLYEFSAEHGSRLRVYDGQATVAVGSTDAEGVKVGKGRELSLDLKATQLASVDPAKFDRDETDSLYNWSARRDRFVGKVNQSSALLASSNSSYNSSYMNGFNGVSSWVYNPVYDMYTYLPGSGYGYSPFGFRYFSPVTVLYVGPSVYSSGGSSSSAASSGMSAASSGLASAPTTRSAGGSAASSSVSSGGGMSAPAPAARAASAPSSGGAARAR